MKLIDYLRNLNPSPTVHQERFDNVVVILGIISVLVVAGVLWSQSI